MKSLGWAPIQYDWHPYKKRRLGHIQREDHVKMQGEDNIYKPRREASEDTNPPNTLISDF